MNATLIGEDETKFGGDYLTIHNEKIVGTVRCIEYLLMRIGTDLTFRRTGVG